VVTEHSRIINVDIGKASAAEKFSTNIKIAEYIAPPPIPAVVATVEMQHINNKTAISIIVIGNTPL
jgi:hypothetical protein